MKQSLIFNDNKMKIKKEHLSTAAFVSGLVICSPFIGIYYGIKWIHNQTPKQKRKREEKEAAEKAEQNNINMEIRELEKQLGLIGREYSVCYYDPYYYDNDNENCSRKSYLAYLKIKVAQNYQSPDIILATKEFKNDMCIEYSAPCQVLVLANKNIYNPPVNNDEVKTILQLSINADEYFRQFYRTIHSINGLDGRLCTHSECGKYEDYFIVHIPGEFKYHEVNMQNEKIKLFIEEFQKKNKKEQNNQY